jgi:hypothetical protein
MPIIGLLSIMLLIFLFSRFVCYQNDCRFSFRFMLGFLVMVMSSFPNLANPTLQCSIRVILLLIKNSSLFHPLSERLFDPVNFMESLVIGTKTSLLPINFVNICWYIILFMIVQSRKIACARLYLILFHQVEMQFRGRYDWPEPGASWVQSPSFPFLTNWIDANSFGETRD